MIFDDEPMTGDDGMDIVDEISILKFPPQGKARGSLAAKIIEWCDGRKDRARWLVDYGITGMDEYPGPETLRQLIAAQFPKPEKRDADPPIERLRQLLPAHVVAQIECNENGERSYGPVIIPNQAVKRLPQGHVVDVTDDQEETTNA